MLFFGVFVLSSSVRAQEMGQIAGGYGEISVRAPGVYRNAQFAVSTQARRMGAKVQLVKVLKAEQQVVAGMNYRLCIRVKMIGSARRFRTATVVVYQNLRKKRVLTSWSFGRCG